MGGSYIKVGLFRAVMSMVPFAWSCGVKAAKPNLSPITAKIERVGSMTHLQFEGRNDWNYDVKRDGKTLTLTLPHISSESQEQLSGIRTILVDSIEINPISQAKSEIKISLSNDRVESFDYLTQKPSQLIIDFFVSDDKVLAEIKKERKKNKEKVVAQAAKPIQKIDVKQKVSRAPASDFKMTIGKIENPAKEEKPFTEERPASLDSLYDFGSLGSYKFQSESDETAVMEAKGNIYLRFPPLRLENPHLVELTSFKPKYQIKKSFSDENTQARSLLALFEKKSYASFIQGKKTFKKIFPTSTYDEILTYLEADTWLELWKTEKRPEYLTKAMNIYKLLMERHPNSPLAERTLINTALLAHETGGHFLATKLLKRYIENYQQSPFSQYAKIYLADSLTQLKDYDNAAAALEDVIKNGTLEARIEAQYRLGDVYFYKQSFRNSEQIYLEAMKAHPRSLEKFPNALFNMAEAQFNLAEYKMSLDSFKKFQETFPTHVYGGLALTRVGELIDLLFHDKHRAQGFYNESYYRYRDSIGGALAHMRSLSQRFKNMKEKELAHSIEEIKRLQNLVSLPQVDEFASFMVADGYFSRGEYLKAAQALIDYFQRNPQPVNIDKFEKRISKSIAKQVNKDLQEGDNVAALGLIEKHEKSWLNKAQRVDLQLARAKIYENMGLYPQALRSFERLNKRMNNLKGTKEEAERRIFEDYPSYDEVVVREAVALYENNQAADAIATLKKVSSIQSLPADEKFDYHYILSKVAFDKEKYQAALQSINLVDPAEVNGARVSQKYHLYLSEVYEKNKQWKKGIELLNSYAKQPKSDKDQAYVLSRLFYFYRQDGQFEAAVTVGKELFEKYAAQINPEKERYYLGESYFQLNQLENAQQTWNPLKPQSMWAELARNRMETADWSQVTKKSIDRIPAMQR